MILREILITLPRQRDLADSMTSKKSPSPLIGLRLDRKPALLSRYSTRVFLFIYKYV